MLFFIETETLHFHWYWSTSFAGLNIFFSKILWIKVKKDPDLVCEWVNKRREWWYWCLVFLPFNVCEFNIVIYCGYADVSSTVCLYVYMFLLKRIIINYWCCFSFFLQVSAITNASHIYILAALFSCECDAFVLFHTTILLSSYWWCTLIEGFLVKDVVQQWPLLEALICVVMCSGDFSTLSFVFILQEWMTALLRPLSLLQGQTLAAFRKVCVTSVWCGARPVRRNTSAGRVTQCWWQGDAQ